MPKIKVNSRTYESKITDGAYLLIVESKRPWYAPDFLIRKGFKNAVPEYQHAEGLIRKNFLIGQNGLFGGLYTWRDRASLDSFYGEARINAIEAKRGMRPILSIFKVLYAHDFPLGLPPSNNAEKEWDGDYVVSVVNKGLAANQLETAKDAYEKVNAQGGQITSYLVQGDDGNIYDIRLWVSQEERDLNLQGMSSKDFDAPVLIEGSNGAL
ncbi:MAG: hypothetical protein KA715_08175 [Xanthomonadaceae bacterium]|nr:hypothetical protein [Xanthomonadaceae bacterium]